MLFLRADEEFFWGPDSCWFWEKHILKISMVSRQSLNNPLFLEFKKKKKIKIQNQRGCVCVCRSEKAERVQGKWQAMRLL